ncbi:hypothetical protein SFRURICE_006717 [Spodoptera frugiperda]|uniref:SFRICE_027441 n=1 Tax=Spodoptera frugiperda TaxID=7108 RepID=A0A2H1WAD6_SPOFR|nr:hypothetical protein SFRURICE_006717 [Spodoptera frugiperda]
MKRSTSTNDSFSASSTQSFPKSLQNIFPDDEIEDVVGEVKLSESQKSVAMSNVYSMDFTDSSSSEKHNSSGMETYILEWDSEDSESSALQGNLSIISVKDSRPTKPILVNKDAQCDVTKKISKSSSTSLNKCSIFAQEIFTQTSKTIIELAESDGAIRKIDSKTLETQTSFISITENKTFEYRIEVSGAAQNLIRNDVGDSGDNYLDVVAPQQIFPNSIDDGSSKFVTSETDNEKSDDGTSNNSSCSNDKLADIVNDDFKDNDLLYDESNEDRYEITSEFEQSPNISDMEEDSLMEIKAKDSKVDNESDTCNTPISVDNDVAELYTKLSETVEFYMPNQEQEKRRIIGYLTPLTEESIVKKDSTGEMECSSSNNIIDLTADDNDVLFTNNAGIKVKLFPKSESNKEIESFKLPPIQGNHNNSDGNLNFLFNGKGSNKNSSPGDDRRDRNLNRNMDRWEIGTKDLASGESPLISGRSDAERASHGSVQLPPIHAEGHGTHSPSKLDQHLSNSSKTDAVSSEPTLPISIKEKIRELKMSHRPRNSWTNSKYTYGSGSRSGSPSTVSPDESRVTDAAERGCELVCIELLKKLRSQSWFEVADSLEDLPRLMDKFWGIIAEHRIADLIRQVTAHVESPRTQVARAACNTLASILKNTNYTKKPDFYEAVTILLIKTGSFSRPVRRAANVALDDIVCGVDLSHAITALCIHGASHKSALVRCAAARLLVVCCALGGGGRDLLRTRPPTAACARKHALRSLALLLDDKSTEARKYAERLYSMLRPLANFEAYYLTDVDLDTASRQMKKYDQLLLCGPPETR